MNMASVLKNIQILWVVLWLTLSCAYNQEYPGFQDFSAGDKTSLPGILAKLPTIDAMVKRMNKTEIQALASSNKTFTHAEKEQLVKTFIKLAEITGDRLPKLVGVVLLNAGEVADDYDHKAGELNSLFSGVWEFLTQLNPDKLSIFSLSAGQVVAYAGQESILFDEDETLSFPSLNEFKACDQEASDSGFAQKRFSFLENSNRTSERAQLLTTFTELRILYCSSLATAGYSTLASAQGEFIYQYLLARQRVTLDPVVEGNWAITESQVELDDFATLLANEEELVSWLGGDSGKTTILHSYLTGINALSKDPAWIEEAEDFVNMASEFLTKKNPNTDELLLDEVLASLNQDAELLTNVEQTVGDVFTEAIDASNGIAFFSDLVDNSSYGLKTFLDAGTKTKLLEMLWDGSQTQAHFVSPFLALPTYSYANGILNSSDEDLAVTNPTMSHYREQLNDILNGDGDGNYYSLGDTTDGNPGAEGAGRILINRNYDGETLSESFLNNLEYYFREQFFDPEKRQWAFFPGDGKRLFGSRDRNAQGFIGKVQYALRNLVSLDHVGNQPSSGSLADESLLTRFLETQALDNLDYSQHFPREMRLKDVLQNIDSDYANGVSEDPTGIYELDLPLMCDDNSCTSGDPYESDSCTGDDCSRRHRIMRNGTNWYPNTNMGALEALTPGKFIERHFDGIVYSNDEFYSHDNWIGDYSQHQGDIENANVRAGGVFKSLIANFVWQGYGPYTYRGKSPGGRKVKYANSFTTDRYRTQSVVMEEGCLGGKAPVRIYLNMGNNRGERVGEIDNCDAIGGGNDNDWEQNIIRLENGGVKTDLLRGSSTNYEYGGRYSTNGSGGGNLKIWERVYRPSSGDSCWDLATEDGTYSYARFGFIRPSRAFHYWNDAQCATWQKVQIDFDTRAEAIQANLDFIINYKKLTLVLPTSGSDLDVLKLAWARVMFAAWSVTRVNGLAGLLTNKGAYFTYSGEDYLHNGAWIKADSGSNPDDDCLEMGKDCIARTSENISGADGFMLTLPAPVGVVGFFKIRNASSTSTQGLYETSDTNGASVTNMFTKTSYEPGDSSAAVIYTAMKSGVAEISWIGESLFLNKKTTHPLVQANSKSLVTLLTSRYETSELISSGFTDTTTDFNKFKAFYDEYFPEDLFDADGNKVSDGTPDMWQRYQRSSLNPGCKDSENNSIYFCLTAEQMPVLPKVLGVTYPDEYDFTGEPATWAGHQRFSDYKFGPFLELLAVNTGTEFEHRRAVYGPAGSPNASCSYSGSITTQVLNENGSCFFLGENQDPDDYILRGYTRKLYKTGGAYRAEFNSLGNFIEAFQIDNSSLYEPEYDSSGLINRFVETSPGARDGLLPRLFSTSFLHLEVLKQEFGQFVDSLLGFFNTISPNANTGTISALTKLRYFVTGDVVGSGSQPFKANGLSSIGSEPLYLVKELLGTLRDMAENQQFRKGLPELLTAINSHLQMNKEFTSFELEIDDLIKLNDLLNYKVDGEYVLDAFLDLIIDESLLNPTIYKNLSLDNLQLLFADLQVVFDNLNTAIVDIYGTDKDLRRLLLLGGMVSEPYYDKNSDGFYNIGEPFYDYNGNKVFDRGGQFDGNASYYSDTWEDQTDMNGEFTVISRIPNFWDLTTLLENYTPLGAEETISEDLTRDDLVSALDDGETLELKSDLLAELKTAILDSLRESTVAETSQDFDGNGTIEADEYVDLNNNGQFDENITSEEYIELKATEFTDDYSNFTQGDWLKAKWLLTNFLRNGCSETSDCSVSNSRYGLGAIRDALGDWSATANVDDRILLDGSLFLGELLTDQAGESNQLLSYFQKYYQPIREINHGTEDISQQSFIDSMAEDRVGRYVLERLYLSNSHDPYDLFADIQTMSDMAAIMEYDHEDTVWYQSSKLLGDLSELSYKQNGMNFTMEDDAGEYFQDFQEMFSK